MMKMFSTSHFPLISPQSVVQKRTYQEKIDRWENEAAAEVTELRQIAVANLKAAYCEEHTALLFYQLGLSTLPDLAPLKNLTSLNLSFNRLTNLSATLPPRLKTLYVTGNRLASIPEGLPVHLKILGVASNQLARLPNKLPPYLKTLDVRDNQLASLPNTLPKNLKNLDADGNCLSTLPDTLPANLKLLSINNNQLVKLPLTLPRRLQTLLVAGNRLTDMPHSLPEDLQTLDIKNNPFIFNLHFPVSIPAARRLTIERFFSYGNTHLLDFNENARLPTAFPSQFTLMKFQRLVDYANKHCWIKSWAWQHSAIINQLLYLVSALPNTELVHPLKVQARALLTTYLNTEGIRTFVTQAEDIISPSDYKGFLFIARDGQQGLTIARECYETHILKVSYADPEHPYAQFANGVLIHRINRDVDLLRSSDDIKPFRLLNEAWLTVLNRERLDTFFAALGLDDKYKQRFKAVLEVTSISALAVIRDSSAATSANLIAYKMVDPISSAYLFNTFSALVNTSTESAVDCFVNRNATLTDAHFLAICESFPSVDTHHYAALMFALSVLFVTYSSASFFGTDEDSPVALRFYANALLNKLQQLNPILFNQAQGARLKHDLLENFCTDSLALVMKSIAKESRSLKLMYELVMPPLWQ